MGQTKNKTQDVDINTLISIITLKVNGLMLQLKGTDCSSSLYIPDSSQFSDIYTGNIFSQIMN